MTADLPPELQALCDRAAIHEVLARYCRAIDRVDMELLASVYHPDAVDDHGTYVGTADGWVEWAGSRLSAFKRTTHFLGNVLIDLDGDVAVAETYVIAYHRTLADELKVTHGRYLDRFERRDTEWRIAHRASVWEWEYIDPAPRWSELPDHFVTGSRDASDPLYGFLATRTVTVPEARGVGRGGRPQ